LTKGTDGSDVMMGDLVFAPGRSKSCHVRPLGPRHRSEPPFTTISFGMTRTCILCTFMGWERRQIWPSALKPGLDLIGHGPAAAPAAASSVLRQLWTQAKSRRSWDMKASNQARFTRLPWAETTLNMKGTRLQPSMRGWGSTPGRFRRDQRGRRDRWRCSHARKRSHSCFEDPSQERHRRGGNP